MNITIHQPNTPFQSPTGKALLDLVPIAETDGRVRVLWGESGLAQATYVITARPFDNRPFESPGGYLFQRAISLGQAASQYFILWRLTGDTIQRFCTKTQNAGEVRGAGERFPNFVQPLATSSGGIFAIIYSDSSQVPSSENSVTIKPTTRTVGFFPNETALDGGSPNITVAVQASLYPFEDLQAVLIDGTKTLLCDPMTWTITEDPDGSPSVIGTPVIAPVGIAASMVPGNFDATGEGLTILTGETYLVETQFNGTMEGVPFKIDLAIKKLVPLSGSETCFVTPTPGFVIWQQ